ncbi:putative acyltransferase [Pedobacter sp. UYEF25]
MSNRFTSLDVFRGITLALMILVNNPGNENHVYMQLDHSIWNGCTLTDLVFPFFLFAVGNSMAFAFTKYEQESKRKFWLKVIKRSLLIFFIGVFLNAFPFFTYNNLGQPILTSIRDFRIFGVLQRIAFCYLFSSFIIAFFKDKGVAIFCFVILFAYWFLCITVNPKDPFSLNGWFGTHFEQLMIGESHMYKGEGIPFEPEGLMSLPAAIVQTVFGYLAGKYILLKGKIPKMLRILLVVGCVSILAGYVWGFSFPINKKIWTSSYAVYTTGIALLSLSGLIYLIEFKKTKSNIFHFFEIFGTNTVFIYIMSTMLPKLSNVIKLDVGKDLNGKQLHVTIWNLLFDKIFSPIFTDQRNSSLLLSVCFVLFLWGMAYWLNYKKVYIKV